jgi:hypothetical protein
VIGALEFVLQCKGNGDAPLALLNWCLQHASGTSDQHQQPTCWYASMASGRKGQTVQSLFSFATARGASLWPPSWPREGAAG